MWELNIYVKGESAGFEYFDTKAAAIKEKIVREGKFSVLGCSYKVKKAKGFPKPQEIPKIRSKSNKLEF